MAAPGTLLRSSAFALLLAVITPPYALLSLLILPLPARARYYAITSWSHVVIWAARTICGVRHRVEGALRPAGGPFVVLANHQSAWETLAMQTLFPPQVMVVKKQLLWVPFFGWGLATLLPIAIDRSAGTRALRQLLEQGKDRLARKFWVVVYPQGTRVRPGEQVKFQTGGAWLACRTGTPVIPVAHNAGYLWPRASFLKHAGTITVVVGTPIPTAGRTPDDVNREVEAWIDRETARIGEASRIR